MIIAGRIVWKGAELLSLNGLAPAGVRLVGDTPRLQWRIDGERIELDFDRFRPAQVAKGDRDGTLEITWRDFGDLSLADDPFFDTSIKRARDLAGVAGPFRTDRETLARVARRPDNLPFAGVVVHMGRCGSTLLHRILACTGKVHSLSEISPVVSALQVTRDWPEETRNAALRDLLAVYRRRCLPTERQFVTKIGSAYLLPEFRAAFPDVPWVFSYRDPLEVMVSALEKPTGLIRAWHRNRRAIARRIGVPRVADPGMPPAEFIARLMRRTCRSALRAAEASPPGLFLAVDYARLPDAIWETVAPHFGIELTDDDKAVMREQSRYSSKQTVATEFEPDIEAKRAKATPAMRRLVERFAQPVYEKLLALPQA